MDLHPRPGAVAATGTGAGPQRNLPRAHGASHARVFDELRLLAVSHHSASMSGYETAALGPDHLTHLREQVVREGLDAVVLSTCNRAELYWRTLGPASDAAIAAVFREVTGVAADSDALLQAAGEAVARHLFRVTCGLDSLLLGEGEVMGQVRDAFEAGHAGEWLAGVFRAALRCGGMARSETAIGAGALSVASAGAQRMARSMAGIERPLVVVVGAGQTATAAARHLRAEGIHRLLFLNRTYERAQAVAHALGVHAAPLEALPAALRDADGVAVAAHAPAFLLPLALVREAQPARNGRPLVVSDLSMPRAVDPRIRELPGVALHDLLGFETAVRENRSRREREIPFVEAVIERELAQLRGWAHQQALRPIMAEFRERAEAIRQAELQHVAGEAPALAEVLDRLTRRLVDRLITIPIVTMRDAHPQAFESCGLQCLRHAPREHTNGNA